MKARKSRSGRGVTKDARVKEWRKGDLKTIRVMKRYFPHLDEKDVRKSLSTVFAYMGGCENIFLKEEPIPGLEKMPNLGMDKCIREGNSFYWPIHSEIEDVLNKLVSNGQQVIILRSDKEILKDSPFLWRVWYKGDPKIVCRICFDAVQRTNKQDIKATRENLRTGGKCDFCQNLFLTPSDVIKIGQTLWHQKQKQNEKALLMGNRSKCPRCGSSYVVSNGGFRWLCKGCGKQFNKQPEGRLLEHKHVKVGRR